MTKQLPKDGFKTFIIAEAGVNHNGSLKLAEELVDIAAWAGADAVKFQTFKAERLVSRTARKVEYQLQSAADDESQMEMLRKFELDEEAHKILFRYSERNGIQFMSSAFDLEGIDMLNSLGVEIFKIPSGEITNLPYLRKIGSLGTKVILSTGMADLGEIEAALDVLFKSGMEKNNVVVLHCNTEYPTPFGDVNLRAMQTIATAFDVKVGYSDHTTGIEVPIAAVALGASVIEKHFTLDKTLPGPDHGASLEPEELREMVRAIRDIELALGNGLKKPSPSELKNKPLIRKSLVAKVPIAKGEFFTEENVTTKRADEEGLSPMFWDYLIGRPASRDYLEDEVVW